jgi:multiple sugar transport system permease protein
MRGVTTTQRILYTLPAILLITVFFAYPLVMSFALSFTNYDGFNKIEFVGLRNYIRLFTSKELLQVLGNNLYFLILGIPLNTFVPLLIAILIYGEIPGFKVFRVLYIFPRVLSAVIIGILFRSIFSYHGPLNEFLKAIGLKFIVREWFASGLTAIPIIVIAKLWHSIGINMLIYLAGMASIPPEIYESADLDGFNWWQKIIYITIPMIKSVFEFIVFLALVTMLASLFSLTFTITDGGPGYESTTLEYFIYIKGFQVNELGYACMIAVLLFVLVIILTRGLIRLFRGKED